MEKNPLKQPSLLTVLTTAFTVAGVLMSMLIIATLYNNFKTGLRDELRNRLVSITTIAALQQDGDTLLKVAARDDEYYKRINEQNVKIRSADPDLVYVYTMRKNEQGIYFVVDANLPGDEGIADFGQPYLEPGPTLEENFDNINETIIEPDFYTDEFGTFLSAYAPIYNSTGEKIGVLGVDITADDVLAKERQFLIRSLLIFMASLPIIALLGYLMGRLVTTPLAKLTANAMRLAEGNLEEQAAIPTSSREAALLAVSFNSMTQKLRVLISTLEMQVADRTEKLEKRAAQLQTVANVARRIATVQDFDALLPDITKLVSEHFGFYHAGIFLIDEKGEYAVLRAANSEGGQRMLNRNHQLKLDSNSIVGFVTSRGESRIALDVGTDAVFFNNPDLPETRSEMALPLLTGRRVIGALDVQSTQPHAFTPEDISILTTLADQIAIAIENARLFSETRQALANSESTFALYVKQEWARFTNQVRNTAYTFDGKRTVPFEGIKKRENGSAGISIPIKFRGQTLGTLDVASQNGKRQWTRDDISLLEAAADRVALALENARLLENAQRRASRERVIGEISSKIGAASDMDSILQTAVEELGRRIGGATEVTLELASPVKEPDDRESH
jgi:GAF domain-containing protein/HAMP domain-containing protein